VPEYPSIFTVPDLKIQGVASMYRITELGTDSSLMASTNEDGESFPVQSVSPLNYVNSSNLHPTFLATGSLDSLVSVKNYRLLHEALNE
jgi:acetyl esterase/lipase